MGLAAGGTLETPDPHYPGAARCQKRRPFGWRSLRISEYRLGLMLLVRPQEDRPKGKKLFPGGVTEVSSKRALSSVRCKY
jgi:hypothetical protein